MFTTTRGAHTVKFAGLNGAPTGETAFMDNVRITGSPKPGYSVQWLVPDHLGTPRMVIDQSGSLANVRRHDYLPFGEDLSAIGGRATSQGYSSNDGVRQRFTGYEMDAESGLNFSHARYQSPVQGRFTSVDPVGASADVGNPQSFNRYSYVLNRPTNLTDPLGLISNNSGTSFNGAERPTDDYPGDPFETGRDIVAAAMAQCDRRIADTIYANGLNQLISSGRMTRDEAEEAIKGNDNLAIQTKGEPEIVFDSVELLDDPAAGFPDGPLNVPRPIRPIRSATRNEFNQNQFTLNVDDPKVDPKGILAIRVKFHIIDGDLDSSTVETTNRDERRWRIAGAPLKIEGGLIFTANVWDQEGKNNPIYVTVRAKWTASLWDKGKLNDVRYTTGRAEIILKLGSRDSSLKD